MSLAERDELRGHAGLPAPLPFSNADNKIFLVCLASLITGIGGFLTTPTDKITTQIIANAKDKPTAQTVIAKVLAEEGVFGFFEGALQRTAYWAFAIAIFLSCYCSFRQAAAPFFS